MKRFILLLLCLIMGLGIAAYRYKMTLAHWIIDRKVDEYEKDIRFVSSLLPLYPLYLESQSLISQQDSTSIDSRKIIDNLDILDQNLHHAESLLGKVAVFNNETEQMKESLRLIVETIDAELPRDELKKMKTVILIPFVDFKHIVNTTRVISSTIEKQYENFQLHTKIYKESLFLQMKSNPKYFTFVLSLYTEDERRALVDYTEQDILAIALDNPDFFAVVDNPLFVPYKKEVRSKLSRLFRCFSDSK